MNRTSRIAQVGIVLLLLASMTALASVSDVTALGRQTDTGITYCESLSNEAAKAQGRFDDLKGKVTAKWSQQDSRIKQLDAQVDQKVADARSKVDARRKRNFAELEKKATTDAQRSAVSTYETAVSDAVTTRRAAVDTARSNFRSAVADAANSRRDTLTTQMSGLQSAIQVAFSTAKASCEGGVEPSVIRATLVGSLKTTRSTFAAQRQSDTKIRTDIDALSQTRQSAVQAADASLKASVKSATDALKAAFGDQKI